MPGWPDEFVMKSLLFAALLGTSFALTSSAQDTGVMYPPEIQSVNMSSVAGTVTFTVLATGDDLRYQWYWQGQEIADGTNSVLRFLDAYATANAGYYSVRVSNDLVPEGVYSSSTALLFTKAAPAGNYQGIFYNEETLDPAGIGFVRFTISGSKQRFTGKLTLGTVNYPFSGEFSSSHEAEVAIPRPGNSELRLHLQLLTLADTPRFTGTLSADTWTSQAEGDRLYFSPKKPTSLVGRYTLSLYNSNSLQSVPNGSGYATLMVRKDGKVAIRGQAGDGTAFSETCGLSRHGRWPLYASLKGGNGTLVGWLHIGTQQAGTIHGPDLYWARESMAQPPYPDQFGIPLTGIGSLYTVPTTNAVIGFTNGVASFFAGDLFSDETVIWQSAKMLLRPPVTFRALETEGKVQLKVSKKTGMLSGSFVNLVTGQRAPVRGVLLQKQNMGQGYFLSSGRSGAFTLSPGTSAP